MNRESRGKAGVYVLDIIGAFLLVTGFQDIFDKHEYVAGVTFFIGAAVFFGVAVFLDRKQKTRKKTIDDQTHRLK
ncbi:MAG: hypothetical protein PHS97_04265 [Oscillospiraceae bacterium]|nr:hypothetical protein [Oscillospiraceae bacterium]